MALVTVCAVATLLGANRANSPLQVKRMLDLQFFILAYTFDGGPIEGFMEI